MVKCRLIARNIRVGINPTLSFFLTGGTHMSTGQIILLSIISVIASIIIVGCILRKVYNNKLRDHIENHQKINVWKRYDSPTIPEKKVTDVTVKKHDYGKREIYYTVHRDEGKLTVLVKYKITYFGLFHYAKKTTII